MTTRYDPDIHDPILQSLRQERRLTDRAIASEMGFGRETIAIQRRRLGLSPNQKTGPQLPRESEAESVPKEKPNPVNVATRWLGNRLEERASGFWLDGRPASLDTVMRETNAVLKFQGLEQVGIERWRV